MTAEREVQGGMSVVKIVVYVQCIRNEDIGLIPIYLLSGSYLPVYALSFLIYRQVQILILKKRQAVD